MSVNVRRLNRTFGSSHSASSAYQKWPTWHSHSSPGPIKRVGLLTHLKFENRLRSFRPKASNHSLYRIKLLDMSASYPEGNFGRNQLLDGSISLSPLYPSLTIDLHVRIAADLHQSFLWLRPTRHSSPSFGSQRVRSCSARRRCGRDGPVVRPPHGAAGSYPSRPRVPAFAFTAPLGFVRPTDSRTC